MGGARDLWGGAAMFPLAALALIGVVAAAAVFRVNAKPIHTLDEADEPPLRPEGPLPSSGTGSAKAAPARRGRAA